MRVRINGEPGRGNLKENKKAEAATRSGAERGGGGEVDGTGNKESIWGG